MKKLTDWINNKLPGYIRKVEINYSENPVINTKEGIDIAGRESVYNVLNNLLAVIFPGFHCHEPPGEKELNLYAGDLLRRASRELYYQIYKAFKYISRKGENGDSACEELALRAVSILIESIPEIRNIIHTDIEAAYNGDPAASSREEIIMSYPFVNTIATHRLAHVLYKCHVPLIPRIMTEFSHSKTGTDIHPGAEIGSSFFIDHGTGVVIGETTKIGKNVKIYQGVTLGALSFSLDKNGNPVKGEKRHPTIEDNVIIYAGATILGGDTVVGEGAVIGGNVWLTHSVNPGGKVYNHQPDRMVKNL